jgi:hypothetical protein
MRRSLPLTEAYVIRRHYTLFPTVVRVSLMINLATALIALFHLSFFDYYETRQVEVLSRIVALKMG